MKLENTKKMKLILQELEDYKCMLDVLKPHSFGFGTAYREFDDYLRPQAELFIRNKITELEKKILEIN